MEIKSITRIDGKIRIVSANFDHERVDDFVDYGLPEVEYLINAFLNHDIEYLKEESDSLCGDHYKIGDCFYEDYRYIRIPSKPLKYISIGKYITNVRYVTFTYIIYGSGRFTTDNTGSGPIYSLVFSEHLAKHYDGRHITEQSFKKYVAVVGHCFLHFHMETMTKSRPRDPSTKLE